MAHRLTGTRKAGTPSRSATLGGIGGGIPGTGIWKALHVAKIPCSTAIGPWRLASFSSVEPAILDGSTEAMCVKLKLRISLLARQKGAKSAFRVPHTPTGWVGWAASKVS